VDFRNGRLDAAKQLLESTALSFQKSVTASATRMWLPSAALLPRYRFYRRVNTGGRASNFRALFRKHTLAGSQIRRRSAAALVAVTLVQRKWGIAVKDGEY